MNDTKTHDSFLSWPARAAEKIKSWSTGATAINWKPWGVLQGYVATTEKIWAKPRSYPFARVAPSLVLILSSQLQDQAVLASRSHDQAAARPKKSTTTKQHMRTELGERTGARGSEAGSTRELEDSISTIPDPPPSAPQCQLSRCGNDLHATVMVWRRPPMRLVPQWWPAAALASGSLRTVGSDLGLTGLDLGSWFF
jgi:hypothetical protein